MSNLNLFEQFSPVTAKAWKQKIQVDLKGADYNEALLWESAEGIHIKPFYHSEDTKDIDPQISHPEQKWSITQRIYADSTENVIKKAVEAVHKGAEGLLVSVPSEDIDVRRLLDEIDLVTHPIHLDIEFLSPDYLKSLVDRMTDKKGNIYLHLDIIGHLARTGNWFHGMDRDHEIVMEILDCSKAHPGVHVLGVDMGLYQNSGANNVQQLAYALAHANEYLNFFKDRDVELPSFLFRTAVGSNYFMEIAKLRALRILWEALGREYGKSVGLTILAEPSKRNKTIYDYNVNMLRTTTECMSAVLGGADFVCNLPYDALFHEENEFGERIARNQLLLLKGESYFDKVTNPADGSYYIETLTQQLAQKALQLFKNIEAGGGFLRQLKDHVIQKKIAESAKMEQQLFDDGKEVLVGTNKYLNPEDKMKGDLQRDPFLRMTKQKTLIAPILERRLAETLEQKRLEDE